MIQDFHAHSNNSFDSKETIENMCISAIEKGIEHIAFTEHFCVNDIRKTFGYMDFRRFQQDIQVAKEKFLGKLNVYKGIEICEPHIMREGYEESLKDIELDVILGSVHNINNLGLKDLIKNYNFKKAYELYFNDVYEMVKKSDFDIAAHLDLLNRYTYKTLGPYDFKYNMDTIEEILKEIIRRGKGIEINTSVFRNKVDNRENSLKIIKLYKSLGGEIITIGSDAHKTEDVGEYCKAALRVLEGFGFKYVFTFKNREPIGNKII
ncbi:MAG: histidinol-phosphatase HisJ family protein [Clostridium sp.]|uniref:histidinol-phosphatase HisJ family protein n=1 Tax=Clostridium sp. TaxID=1506 RepID=UPI00301EC489